MEWSGPWRTLIPPKYLGVNTGQDVELQDHTYRGSNDSPPARGGTAQKEDNSSGKLESTHPSRTSVKSDQGFFWCRVSHCVSTLDSLLHPSCCYLDIRDFEWFDNGPDHGKTNNNNTYRWRWKPENNLLNKLANSRWGNKCKGQSETHSPSPMLLYCWIRGTSMGKGRLMYTYWIQNWIQTNVENLYLPAGIFHLLK